MPPHHTYVKEGIKPRVFCIRGKHSTKWALCVFTGECDGCKISQLCFVLFTVLFVFLHKLLLASMFQWPSLPPPLFSCIWTIFYISILLMTPPVLSVFYIFLFTLCIGNQKTACRCSPIIIKNSFQVQQRDALRQDFCLLATGELECDTEPAATPKQKWTLLYGEC